MFLMESLQWSKNLFSKSWRERPKTWGQTPFPDPISLFGVPWSPFWFTQAVGCSRWCGITGGERVSPSRRGWYFILTLHLVILGTWSLNSQSLNTLLLTKFLSKKLSLHHTPCQCIPISTISSIFSDFQIARKLSDKNVYLFPLMFSHFIWSIFEKWSILALIVFQSGHLIEIFFLTSNEFCITDLWYSGDQIFPLKIF